MAEPDRLSPDVLRPFMGRLVPVLLKNMVRATANLQTAGESFPCPLNILSSSIRPHFQDRGPA